MLLYPVQIPWFSIIITSLNSPICFPLLPSSFSSVKSPFLLNLTSYSLYNFTHTAEHCWNKQYNHTEWPPVKCMTLNSYPTKLLAVPLWSHYHLAILDDSFLHLFSQNFLCFYHHQSQMMTMLLTSLRNKSAQKDLINSPTTST